MMENHLTPYQSVISEIKSIISSGQEAAYSASSKAMLLTYWNASECIAVTDEKDFNVILNLFGHTRNLRYFLIAKVYYKFVQ